MVEKECSSCGETFSVEEEQAENFFEGNFCAECMEKAKTNMEKGLRLYKGRVSGKSRKETINSIIEELFHARMEQKIATENIELLMAAVSQLGEELKELKEKGEKKLIIPPTALSV